MHTYIFPQKNAMCVLYQSHIIFPVTSTEAALFALLTRRYVISDYTVNSLCFLEISMSDFFTLHTGGPYFKKSILNVEKFCALS